MVRVRVAPPSAADGIRVRYGRAMTAEQDVGCAGQYVLGGVESEQDFELRRQLPGAFSLVRSRAAVMLRATNRRAAAPWPSRPGGSPLARYG